MNPGARPNPVPADTWRDLARPAAIVRFDAAAVQDASGLHHAPGSLLVRFSEPGPLDSATGLSDAELLAVGATRDIARHEASPRAAIEPYPDAVLIPGLVNAHTHLDLTHIGPVPPSPDGGFGAFVDLVRSRRRADAAGIAESVRTGIALSLAGGTVAIGDIAGAPRGQPSAIPFHELTRSPLSGVSFLEFFAMGKAAQDGQSRAASALERGTGLPTDGSPSATPRLRLGLQPHAPNTVSLDSYRWAVARAAELGLPLSTHLAETPDEREYIAHAAGPMRTFLEALGIWDDSLLAEIGRGLHPVAHLRPILEHARFLAAHASDTTDEAIGILARTGTSVAYCPRASEYFRAADVFGPHRYRDMLAAGVNVCLGTDSIINLPPGSADPARGMSIVDEMRLLHTRDGTPPGTLLAMATTNGARALGLDQSSFLFTPGRRLAGLVSVPLNRRRGATPGLGDALKEDTPASLLFIGK